MNQPRSAEYLRHLKLDTMTLPAVPLQQTLTESARAVLRIIARSEPMTRPQLSAALSFSKPTMSAAVSELETYGLVASNGIVKGTIGRSAVTYGLGPGAGFVLGVD